MRTYTITQEYINKQSRIDPELVRGVTGPGEYTWNERLDRYVPVPERKQAEESSAIFSIGGIGIAIENEMPTIPSAVAIERYNRRVSAAQVCRRCGASELDGAMFTTIAGSGICDDCV